MELLLQLETLEIPQDPLVKTLPINAGNSKQVSFTFTPSADLKPGEYMLMIGAENESVSYLKAVKINIL